MKKVMHIYQAAKTLLQSHKQLHNKNIQFLAYDKCSNSHALAI